MRSPIPFISRFDSLSHESDRLLDDAASKTPDQNTQRTLIADILGACVAALGEAFMTSHYSQFIDWTIDKAPYAPEFINEIKTSPDLTSRLLNRYLRTRIPFSMGPIQSVCCGSSGNGAGLGRGT